jgi:hypothetical protein
MTEAHILSATENKNRLVRFQVLMAASTKMIVFRDVAPCKLVEAHRRFRHAYYLHYQGNYWGKTKKVLHLTVYLQLRWILEKIL